nr:hypothetical protein CFP56_71205 [Quercus suber]
MRGEQEKEMLVMLNPDEQGLEKKVGKLINPSEEMARPNNSKCKTEPRFKSKIGSVFPAKKRLVKRMMFDYIFHSLAKIFCPPGSDTGSPPFSIPSQPKNNNNGCFKICTTPKSSNPKKTIIHGVLQASTVVLRCTCDSSSTDSSTNSHKPALTTRVSFAHMIGIVSIT